MISPPRAHRTVAARMCADNVDATTGTKNSESMNSRVKLTTTAIENRTSDASVSTS